jgi:hypothetical protein
VEGLQFRVWGSKFGVQDRESQVDILGTRCRVKHDIEGFRYSGAIDQSPGTGCKTRLGPY